MGKLKKLIPKSRQPVVAEWIKGKVPPEGLMHDQAANSITLGGFLLVAAGAKLGGRAGMFIRMLGHFGDDLDGDMARLLGTADGKFGKMLDATTDKFKIAIEAKEAWKGSMQLEGGSKSLRQGAIGIIAAKNAANASLNFVAMARGRNAETSTTGQANFYADSLALGFFGWSDVVKSDRSRNINSAIGYTFVGIGIVTGALAFKGYYNQAFGEFESLPNGNSIVNSLETTSHDDPYVIAAFSSQPLPDELG